MNENPALALVRAIRSDLDRLEETLTGQPVAARPAQGATPPADDADLDGPYGNPEIKFDPKRWSGQSFVGCRFSDCPPDYLETLAGYLDWQARVADEKNEMLNNGKPKSHYKRLDAARARGWARRNASKSTGRPAAARPRPTTMNDPDMPSIDGDDLPF